MRNHLLSINLVLLAITAYSLPAPSALNEREKRLNAPTLTPAPRQQILQTPQAPQTRSSNPRQQAPQTRTATIQTTKAVAPQGPGPATTVVIDAGHGGHDRRGNAGQRGGEERMKLDGGARLEGGLQSDGYGV